MLISISSILNYPSSIIKDFNNKTKAQNTERANIIGEIDALNKRYQNALLKNADGEMADDDFQEVKKLTKGKMEVLERRLNDLATGIGSAPQGSNSSLSLQESNPWVLIPAITKKATLFELLFVCDPAGIRTQDPYIKSVLLYQLSYGILLLILKHRFVV